MVTYMISKSIILIVVAVIVVGGAGAAAYVVMNDGGSDSNDSGGDVGLVENDNYSYWLVDTAGDRYIYSYTIDEVLGDSKYMVRTLINYKVDSIKEMTYDEYVKMLFGSEYYPDDSWTREGNEILDKNTLFDGVNCTVWTEDRGIENVTAWVGADDDVLYYYEDVFTLDGESATLTYRLVTCTFLDKL